MNDQTPLSRAERIQAAANQANAEQWSRWADDIATRLHRTEVRLTALLGPDGVDAAFPDDEQPAIVMLLDDWVGGERKERSEGLAKLAGALDARIEAEVATLSETLSAKLDGKIFDLAELRKFKFAVEAAGHELKAHVGEQVGAVANRVTDLSERIDNVDRRRRADRQAEKEHARDDLTKAVTMFEAIAKKIHGRLDEQDQRLAAIEEALHEAYRDPHSPLRLAP